MDKRADFGRHPPLPADVTLLRAVRGALDWWREAGVDAVFSDVPQPWIAVPVMGQEAASSEADSALAIPVVPDLPARAALGGDRAGWPKTLAEFAPWWLSEPSLDAGQQRGRVVPRGPGAAALMVLVAAPEAQDSDILLSGPQGALLTAMLAAMELPETCVYIASALPRHTPMADWTDLAAQGLGQVLGHHLALVAPQRVIAFGRHITALLEGAGLVSPLAHHDPTQKLPILRHLNHEGGSVPLLAARDLGSLLERPIAKGAFWQHWLEWIAGG